MNEEIKEIMRSITVDRIVGTQEYCCIEKEKVRTLLDYITNLQQRIEQLEKENEQLQTQVNTYENPDDLTLFYMWIDEKAKDKIKQLENIRKEAIKYLRSDEYAKDYENSNCRTHLLNILNKGSN